MSSLVAWLKDQTIGELTRSAPGRLRFHYTAPVRPELAGAPVLSVSMPVRNLLVPGEVPDAALAGAVPASEAEVARRLRDLPVNPLGVDRQVRVSLAGMQAKLLVTRTAGGWALPGTTPSTHILKPESPVWTSSVANESFCLEVARQAGLAVTEAEVRRFEDVVVLAVKRYDRVVEAGAVERIHQEDFAQSLGLTPGRKYQGTGGASLADCARVLERWSRVDDRLGLLDMVALSLAVGNADLHAKNLSLLHGPDHSIRLAPVYDLTGVDEAEARVDVNTTAARSAWETSTSALVASVSGTIVCRAGVHNNSKSESRPRSFSRRPRGGRIAHLLGSVPPRSDCLPSSVVCGGVEI